MYVPVACANYLLLNVCASEVTRQVGLPPFLHSPWSINRLPMTAFENTVDNRLVIFSSYRVYSAQLWYEMKIKTPPPLPKQVTANSDSYCIVVFFGVL